MKSFILSVLLLLPLCSTAAPFSSGGVPGPGPGVEVPPPMPMPQFVVDLTGLYERTGPEPLATTIFHRISSPVSWGVYDPLDPSNRVYASGNYTGEELLVELNPFEVFGVFFEVGNLANNGTIYSEAYLNVHQPDVTFDSVLVNNPEIPEGSMIFQVQNLFGDGNPNLNVGCTNCRPVDVAMVPLPGSALLMGTALLGLGLIRRPHD